MTDQSGPSLAAFDKHADGYDSAAASALGRELRARVHAVLSGLLDADDHVIDLGCGTGIDSAWLGPQVSRVQAFDESAAMVEAACNRCAALVNVTVTQADITSLEVAEPADLMLANFGVVNCLPDFATLRSLLVASLRRGGRAVLVTMPRWCPVELGIGIVSANRSLVNRRRTNTPSEDYGGSLIRYASASQLATALAPGLELVDAESLGLVLPPFEQRRWLEHRPRLRGTLASLDQRLGHIGARAGLGDHHIAVFERTAR